MKIFYVRHWIALWLAQAKVISYSHTFFKKNSNVATKSKGKKLQNS